MRRDAGRAQSKLESDSPRRQELSAEAKEAEASLLRQTVQFPALAVEPRGAPKKPFWPGASGFRKRKREPLQDQQLSILDDTVLRAHLAMP